MAIITRHIVVAATPNSPLLPDLLHALFHTPNLEITLLTRETTIPIHIPSAAAHGHKHSHSHENGHTHGPTSRIWHIQTSFSESELASLFKGKDTVICCLTGAEIHLSVDLIDAARNAGVERFIPSEYGLDTGNEKVRALLSPYQNRFEVQGRLKWSGMKWTAIYSGVMLEDSLKTDGVLDIDVLWASVAVFPHDPESKIALSSHKDVASAIVDVIMRPDGDKDNVVYTAGFQATLEEIVAVVEKELDRKLDRYEASLEGAKKEALERMKMGYFDGGISLMARVAVWDSEVNAWGAWKDVVEVGKGRADWEPEVRKVVKMVREGQIKGDDCGC